MGKIINFPGPKQEEIEFDTYKIEDMDDALELIRCFVYDISKYKNLPGIENLLEELDIVEDQLTDLMSE